MVVTQYRDQEKISNTIDDLIIYLYRMLETADLRDDREVRRLLIGINAALERFGITMEDALVNAIGTQYDEGAKHIIQQIRAIDTRNELEPAIAALTSAPNMDTLINLQTDAMLDMKAAIRTARLNSNRAILDTLDGIKRDLQIGTLAGLKRDKVTQMVADTFSRGGLTAFITSDGKRLPLDFYAETVTRTQLSKAANHGAVDRYADVGLSTFTVTGGDPTCPECAKYRGRVFTTGDDPRFYQIDPYDLFPRHPRCKCIISPYVEAYKSEQQLLDDIAISREFDPNKDDPRYTEKRAKAYKEDQKKKRQARQELKQYNEYRMILGDDAPKTLGAFRRMRRADTATYKRLKAEVISLRRADITDAASG